MQISTQIQPPTIDKIVVQTYDFKLTDTDSFDFKTTLRQGVIINEKKVLNVPGLNIDIEPDRQGDNKLMLKFNPNNTDLAYIETICRDVGLRFDIAACQVIRTDIERHKQLKHNLSAYHNIINASAYSRASNVKIKETIRIGINTGQIEFYDKSKESKLKTPRIIRCEARYLKAKALQAVGVTDYKSLMDANIMHLYISAKTKLLPKLDSIPTDSHIADLVSQLESCFENHPRPMDRFLALVGIQSVGIHTIKQVIDSAAIPKQKRYNAKKHLDKIAAESIPGAYNETLIQEIQSFFAA